MASFNGNIGTPSGGFNLKVEYSVTQNIEENYSDVSATGYVKRNNSSYMPYNSYGGDGNLSINGNNKYSKVAYDLRTDGYKTIMTHSQRVYHNDDGTKTIPISFSFNGNLQSYYPNGSVSQNIELPTIPRSSLKIKSNGEWKNGTPYVRVNGEWKRATAYIRVNGEWKRGK